MKSIYLRLSIVLFLSLRSYGVGIENLHIADLVKSSDLIAIAEVTAVTKLESSEPLRFRDQELPANLYSGSLRLRRVIQGTVPPEKTVTVTYRLPTVFVGYRGLSTGTRLVLLRREQDHYTIADPYYPDFPAVALADPESETPSDRVAAVIREMLRVIASPAASGAEKAQILRVDYALPQTKEVIAALRAGLANSAGPDLKQRLLGELLIRGDLTALPPVMRLLLTNTATPDQSVWLKYVIANRLNDRRATHDLLQLLKSADASLRAVAMQAFWHIADPATVPELSARLEDPDEQVRFYTVKTFSDIANDPAWGEPSLSEFQEHQQNYLVHWKQWAKSRQ